MPGRKYKYHGNNKDYAEDTGRKTILRARFDERRCAKGLKALRAYKAEWDEDARVFKRTPNHDWASHSADAWRYLSMAWDFPVVRVDKPKRTPRVYRRGIWVLTVDQERAIEL
jgi:hypothetical protein